MFEFVATAAIALASYQQQAQPIVVTAPAPMDHDNAHRVASDFVNEVTEQSFGQVPRFHGTVCPVVVALSSEHAQMVRSRIVETARGVGASVDADPKCSANLTVIIAEDSRKFVSDVRRNRPDWLDGLSPWQVSATLDGPGPVRAWSVASIANELGGSKYIPKRDEAQNMRVLGSSIVARPTRVEIEGSFVVIDRAATQGLTVAQLADYAAMRGLARTRPPERRILPSILDLFASGAVRPNELTRSDIIFLQALYRSRGTESAVQQRAELARAMAQDAPRR